MRRLQIANRNLTPDTKQWAENTVRINALKARLRELNDVALQSAVGYGLGLDGRPGEKALAALAEYRADRTKTVDLDFYDEVARPFFAS